MTCEPTSLVWRYTRECPLGRAYNMANVFEALAPTFVKSLSESPMPTQTWGQQRATDKAFCCTWLNERDVLVGTKAHEVLRLQTPTGRCENLTIARLPGISYNGRAPRPPDGVSALQRNPGCNFLATGGSEPQDCHVLQVAPDGEPALAQPTLWDAPVQHHCVAWATDSTLVGGSRREGIAVWHVADAHDATPVRCTLQKEIRVPEQIRDVYHHAQSGTLAALGWLDPQLPAEVMLFNAHMDVMRRVTLTAATGATCIIGGVGGHAGLWAVGSYAGLHLIDLRMRRAEIAQPVQDGHTISSVRSLTHMAALVSAGGEGEIAFYDLRKQAYLDRQTLSAGWGGHDVVYDRYFGGRTMKQTAFAHAWSPSHTQLFACGGPMAAGLTGHYFGLWR